MLMPTVDKNFNENTEPRTEREIAVFLFLNEALIRQLFCFL